MTGPLRKIDGDESDEKWKNAVNTDDFRAIESHFHNTKRYDFAGYKVTGTGERGDGNYVVTFTFDDSNENTLLEASLVFRNNEHADTKITRDFIEDNEIVRTEVYTVQNDEKVALAETLD